MDLRRLSKELVPFSCHLGESPCVPPLPSVSGHGLVFFAVSSVVQEPSSLGFSTRISHFQVQAVSKGCHYRLFDLLKSAL